MFPLLCCVKTETDMTDDGGKKCARSKNSDDKVHSVLSREEVDDASCRLESNSGKKTENLKTES